MPMQFTPSDPAGGSSTTPTSPVSGLTVSWRMVYAYLVLIVCTLIVVLLVLFASLTSVRTEVLRVSRLYQGQYWTFTNLFFNVVNSSHIPIKIVVAEEGASPGSVETIHRIHRGDADIGLIQSDTHWRTKKVQTIAYIFDEVFYWFTYTDRNPFSDDSHKTCSLREGSQTRVNLQALRGWSGRVTHLQFVDGQYDRCYHLLKNRDVDSAFFVSGRGNPRLKDFAKLDRVTLIQIPDEFLNETGKTDLSYALIKKGSFGPNLPSKDIETIKARATLMASSELSDRVVYDLTYALRDTKLNKMLKEDNKFSNLEVGRVKKEETWYEEHPGATLNWEEDEPGYIQIHYPEIAISFVALGLILQLGLVARTIRRASAEPVSTQQRAIRDDRPA